MSRPWATLAMLLLFGAVTLSGCNLTVAEPTMTPTSEPSATTPPTATTAPTATPVPEDETGTPVIGWYGLVTGLPAGSQFNDYLFLLSEGAGSVGIAGADDALEARIVSLRDSNTRAHFWGSLSCDVPDYNGCQLRVRRILAEGEGISEPVAVRGWIGRLYSTSAGAGYDDYFVLLGDRPMRYGIAVPPENDREGAFSLTLAAQRDSGALLSVSGDVICGVADANGCQIRVAELAIVDAGQDGDTSGGGETVSSEPVEGWAGTLVRNGAGAPYTYGFQFWEATRRVGVTSVDATIQGQIAALAGTGRVRVWGTLYHNNPATPDDDVIYVAALEAQVPTPAPRTPTPTPIVIACNLPPRLQVGNTGRVSPGPLPNALRSAPGTGGDSVVLGNLPGGTTFTVLQGPICASGYYWWRVDAGGFVGWTAEGRDGVYWLDPLSCSSGLPIRLTPGQQGRVTLYPALSNTVRSQPGRNVGSVVGEIPPGGVFNVLSGPQCGPEGMAWWRVNYNGLIGWTAEGESGVYWLEPATGGSEAVNDWRGVIVHNGGAMAYPLGFQFWEGMLRVGVTSSDAGILAQLNHLANNPPGVPVHIWGILYPNKPGGEDDVVFVSRIEVEAITPPPPACTLPPRLSAGYTARVTPGDPNTVRTAPGTGGGSTVQANIPGGTIFRVIEGPRCVDGYNWWRITTGSLTGWTAEGYAGVYWLEPLMCGNGLRSRLVPGMQGRVTYDPPNANTVRDRPGETGTPIGQIPPGGVFTVLDGPQCAIGGMTWWRVNYNGLVGWTAEGVPGQYWLEPVS